MNLPAQDLSPGDAFGAYKINKLLGRGGMGAVYEAVHEDDGRVVALKLLSVELDNMDSRQRFLREGQTAAAINHPNAVYIYGTEEINGIPVISMELVPGGNLEEKVKERGPLAVDEAVQDILQVIDGLDAALAAGVLHRDVKPANCFVNTTGVVKIGDFGLSKPVDSAEQQKLTQTGVFLGTPVFSSPEQLLGEKLDERSDIYAVGVTFYYLLTGALPYTSGSMMQVVAAVLNGSPAPLESHRKDIPEAVREVVMKSIARKSVDRYQTYDEFRAAVGALRKPETSPATLWDRFRAAVVDGVIVGLLGTGAYHLLITAIGKDWTTTSPQGLKITFALSALLTFLIIGVPEGLRGMSIGKWMLGIRVVNLEGAVPGLVRALTRVALLQLIGVVSLVANLTGVNQATRTSIGLLASVALHLLLLVTIRRGNGVMMVHDWITGTRVIKRLADVQKRHGEAQRREAPTLSGNERRIGPYSVVGALGSGDSVLLGWDASMHRSVWIVPQPDGAPEIQQARRDLARLTRLRWVAGRRAPGENWDAYEAPLGETLAMRLHRPVPWSVLQDWMLDLSSELCAAQADGTMPSALNADTLWVTSSDRIIVPESAGDPGTGARDADTQLAFIASVVERIRSSTGGGTPLPRYATHAMVTAKSARSVDEVHALFKATVGRPVNISRMRRGGLLAATIGVVLFFPIVAVLPIRTVERTDPDGRKLSSLLQFITDSTHALPDSLRPKKKKKTDILTKFDSALRKAGWLPLDTALNHMPPDEYRHERRLAQVYVAGVLQKRVHDTLSTQLYGRSPPDVRIANEAVKLFSAVDSTELREARVLVDSTWHGSAPGASVDLLIKVVAAVMFVFFPWTIAACAIIIAVLARRGILMRGFSIDVVTKTGEPAGRLRILARNLISWSPVLVPIVMYYTIMAAPVSLAAAAMYISIAAVGAAFGLGLWMAVTTTERGIPDRVAGTYLVPE
jgi:uncharacterized RDD family membrane protein YckC